MKNRILTFVIGVLVGAIIMTSVFLIFNKTNMHNDFKTPMNMNGNMPQGQMTPNSNIKEQNNTENTNTAPENQTQENTQNTNSNN